MEICGTSFAPLSPQPLTFHQSLKNELFPSSREKEKNKREKSQKYKFGHIGVLGMTKNYSWVLVSFPKAAAKPCASVSITRLCNIQPQKA